MTKGWFDLFRDNGGPTMYAYSNRTSVIVDSASLVLYVVFATLLVAFLIVFPGIRKERFTTFLSVTLSLFVGVSILVGTCGMGWHVAEAEISSAYKSFSLDKIHGKMGIYIGLRSVNVTLEAMPIYYNKTMDVNFNERFNFDRPTELQEEFRNALIKGLPFPILTVAEYLAVDSEGFSWGRTYREAGFFTGFFLWTSFSLWICMNLLLVVVPRYGAYTMTLTGIVMLFSNFIYYQLLPNRPLAIRIEDVVFRFELGWCFWLVLTAGLLCFMVGSSISIIDLIYPHKFSTIIEMDYGTPFDRHTIIEDSHETKKKKKWMPKLEEANNGGNAGFGSILRRLSKRDHHHRGLDSMHRHPQGSDNYAFEFDVPKSPWRYPHLMFRSDSRKSRVLSMNKQDGSTGGDFIPDPRRGFLKRTDSKDSSVTSLSNVSYRKEELRPSMSVPAHILGKQFRRSDSNESSMSSLASLGLGFLAKNSPRNATGHSNLVGDSLQSTTSRLPIGNNNKNIPSPLERGDSSASVISRGYVVSHGTLVHQSLARSVVGGCGPVSGLGSGSSLGASESNTTGSTAISIHPDEVSTSSNKIISAGIMGQGSVTNSRKSSDEVSVELVGRRKNSSSTSAVRKDSEEHKDD